MKFTINTKELLKGLNAVSKAVPSSPQNAVLKGYKMVCDEKGLKLMASDGTLSIGELIPFDNNDSAILSMDKQGEVVLPHLLLDIVKKMSGEVTKIELLKDNEVQVRSGKSKFKLNCVDVSLYPNISFELGEAPLTFTSGDFVDMIEKTSFAASDNVNVRPILSGIHFVMEDQKLQIQATDSHRLAKKECTMDFSAEFNVVVPKTILKDKLLRLIDSKNQEISVSFSENQIAFAVGNTTLVARLLEGKFPDTSRLVPLSFMTTIEADVKGLLAAVERTSILHEKNTDTLRLNFLSNQIDISSRKNEYGEVKESVDTYSFTGEEIEVNFNATYLKQALKGFKGDKVLFGFNGIMKPVRLVDNLDAEYLQLLLPVRTY